MIILIAKRAINTDDFKSVEPMKTFIGGCVFDIVFRDGTKLDVFVIFNRITFQENCTDKDAHIQRCLNGLENMRLDIIKAWADIHSGEKKGIIQFDTNEYI